MSKALLVFVATIALVGCATVPVSRERVQASEQAIQTAVSAGAERDAESAKYLELARGELADGNKLSDKGEPAHAEKVLERSEADARLAAAIARENAAQANVTQTAEMLRQIQ